MDIIDVTACVTDLDEAADFYGTVLGLPTDRAASDAAVLVRVGSSRLRLEHHPGEAGGGHLAFTIPAGGFDAAKRWLLDRVDLLTQEDRDEFEGPAGWDSRSLYFAGPSRSVLELIARHRLPDRLAGDAFTAADLLCVSEVGVAVRDVPAAARRRPPKAGLEPFGGPPGDAFAALGDDHGLLILVAEGRVWAPTPDRPARPSFQTVTASTGRAAGVDLGRTRVSFTAGPAPRAGSGQSDPGTRS